MENFTGIILFDYIRDEGKIEDEALLMSIIYKVTDVMSYLHKNKIIIRNLKLENILF